MLLRKSTKTASAALLALAFLVINPLSASATTTIDYSPCQSGTPPHGFYTAQVTSFDAVSISKLGNCQGLAVRLLYTSRVGNPVYTGWDIDAGFARAVSYGSVTLSQHYTGKSGTITLYP